MVNQGYKKTEIGVIPIDWEYTTWETAGGGFSSGATPYRAIEKYYNGDIKWVSSGELNYNVIFDTFEHISDEAKTKTNLRLHPANTFLMAITGLEAAGTRGSCAILGVPATTNQSCMAVYGTNKLDVKYLFYFYTKNGDDLAFKFCQGTKQQSFTAAIVKKLPIILPPIEEQKLIAEALSDIGNMISSLEKLIAKKKAVKQGAMQGLLTGKKRLSGFTGEWIKVQLKDIFDFYKGNGLSKEKVSANGKNACILYGELFTRYTEVIENIINKTNSDEGLRSYQFDVLMPGSTTTSGLDLATASVIMDNDVLLGGDIVVLRPKKEMDTRIFGYLLRIMAREILQHTQGITIVHLNTKTLREMEVLIPKTVEEQTAIADILADMDNEIEALEQKLAKTRQIKQGMMQQLLTGKIRLV